MAKSTTSKGTLWGKMQKALQNQGEMRQREVYAKLIGAKLLIPGGTTWFTSLDKWGGEKPDANRRLQKKEECKKSSKRRSQKYLFCMQIEIALTFQVKETDALMLEGTERNLRPKKLISA